VRPASEENSERASATAPVKRIRPRVTTCRCGDPAPDLSEQQ
jgi:hypothetical protein